MSYEASWYLQYTKHQSNVKKDILCTFGRVLYQMIKQNLQIDLLIAWFDDEFESFVQSMYCDVQSNCSGDKIIQNLFSTFSLFPK